MTTIYTKQGKRKKLTDRLSLAHYEECRKKILSGDYREIGIRKTFITERPGVFIFRHCLIDVEVTTEVEDTSLWHQCAAFAYWETEEFSELGVMRHQGRKQFCYLSVNWDALDHQAVNYAKDNITLLPAETWEEVIHGWKGRVL